MLDPRLGQVVAVARAGSMLAASRLVGITQSAVTKSVADLERQVGFQIFHRHARGILLTERGRDFVERTARLLEDARELLSGSDDSLDAFAGVIRVGVCPASLEWQLIEPLASLLQQHPSVRFEVIGSSFERMIQQLRGGGVDVAVGFDAAFRDWSDLKRDPIGDLRSAMFVRKGHPLVSKADITVADIAAYDFVSPSDSRPYGSTIREFYQDQGVDWRKHLHIIDFFPIGRRIVATSDAIGLAAISYAHSRAFRSQFELLEALDAFAPAPMCCATRARWEPKPAVRAFTMAMRASLTL